MRAALGKIYILLNFEHWEGRVNLSVGITEPRIDLSSRRWKEIKLKAKELSNRKYKIKEQKEMIFIDIHLYVIYYMFNIK